MINPLRVLAEAYKIVAKRRDEDRLRKGKAHIAKVFNDMYTYSLRWDESSSESLSGTGMYGFTPRKGYAWMCPSCNKVHLASECSALTGIQYPACCDHREGHRLYDNIESKKWHQ